MGAAKGRRKKKLKHLITRSCHRERLLSSLMRPNEILIALLSPVFFLLHRWRRASASGP